MPALLAEVGEEELAGERERALDDHVVERHEVDLRHDVARVGDQPLARVDEVLVEELDERGVDVAAGLLEAALEASPSSPSTSR